MKKYLFVLLIVSLLAFGCSKTTPIEPEPRPKPTQFTLYVNNDTYYDVGIKVNGNYVGLCSAYTTQNMGIYSCSQSTHLEALDYDYNYYWERYVDTSSTTQFTWRLTY